MTMIGCIYYDTNHKDDVRLFCHNINSFQILKVDSV